MIKTLIKLKILKLIIIGGVSTAYVFKKYCDQKNEVKSKKDKKLCFLIDKNFFILLHFQQSNHLQDIFQNK